LGASGSYIEIWFRWLDWFVLFFHSCRLQENLATKPAFLYQKNMRNYGVDIFTPPAYYMPIIELEIISAFVHGGRILNLLIIRRERLQEQDVRGGVKMKVNGLMAIIIVLMVSLLAGTVQADIDVAEPANGKAIDWCSSHGTYPGAKAFDGVMTPAVTEGRWLPRQSEKPNCYVTWQFTNGNLYAIGRYRIMTQHATAAKRGPKDFQLYGSNDGTDWTELDARTGESLGSADIWSSYTCASMGAFEYYKFNVSDWSDIDSYGGIREIELYGEAYGTTLLAIYRFLDQDNSSADVETNSAAGVFTIVNPSGNWGFSSVGDNVFAKSTATTNAATAAVAAGDYFSFKVTPNPWFEFALTELKFTTLHNVTGAGTQETGGSMKFFVRSSVDNFAANIGGATYTETWMGQTSRVLYLNDAVFQGIRAEIEFRFYIYDSGFDATGSGGRVDTVILEGFVAKTSGTIIFIW